MNSINIIYITFSDADTANQYCKQLLTEKRIACANIYGIQSLYPWAGTLHQDDEYVAICKTSMTVDDELMEYLEKIHPYEVPCIWTTQVNCNLKYRSWINSVLNGKS